MPIRTRCLRAGKRRHGLIVGISEPRDRMPAAAALDAGVELRRQQFRAGGAGDAEGIVDHRRPDRRAAEHDRRRLVAPQHFGDVLDDVRGDLFRRDRRQRRAFGAAIVPARVGWRDQCRDLAVRGARRLNGGRGVLPHCRDRLHDARPGRDAARPAVGVTGQRRIERAVIARLVADHIDDRRAGAAGIVQIGKTVREARRAMQQRARGLFRHPAVTIGRAGRHALEQTQHAMHARHAIERGDEMHLAGAGIGETCRDARREQRADEGFSAVHE